MVSSYTRPASGAVVSGRSVIVLFNVNNLFIQASVSNEKKLKSIAFKCMYAFTI